MSPASVSPMLSAVGTTSRRRQQHKGQPFGDNVATEGGLTSQRAAGPYTA